MKIAQVLLLYCSWVLEWAHGKLTTEECRELGFDVSLVCSACSSIESVELGKTDILANCNACCDQGTDESKKLYAKAVLEVCG